MLYLIPTPIGNLSDISSHSLEILKTTEIILCEDIRVCKKLLNLLEIRYSISFGKKEFYSVHSHNEREILPKISELLKSKICAYLSDAGMPCISDPGGILVKFAKDNLIPYEVISGSNALLLAAAASGMVEKEFTFLAFLSNSGKDRVKEIENALLNPYPVIIYESPKRVLALVESIVKFDENREIFLIKEATKKFETKFWGLAKDVLKTLKTSNLNGEWTLVIAPNLAAPSDKITTQDIIELEIPPKQKAKLLSKLTGENIKDIYKKLTN